MSSAEDTYDFIDFEMRSYRCKYCCMLSSEEMTEHEQCIKDNLRKEEQKRAEQAEMWRRIRSQHNL